MTQPQPDDKSLLNVSHKASRLSYKRNKEKKTQNLMYLLWSTKTFISQPLFRQSEARISHVMSKVIATEAFFVTIVTHAHRLVEI